MFSFTDTLAGKQVIVLGFGRQGQAAARFLARIGAIPLATDGKTARQLEIDKRDFKGVRLVLGQSPAAYAELADLIVVSGGVPLTHPLILAAARRGIPITNDAQLFVERSPAPVLALTGSAGKTTTTTLVGKMMKNAGFRTWIGGNIGTPLIDIVQGIQPDDQVVLELSSFQTELMHTSPAINGILNITPNHLDRHGTMANYIRAKANIMLHGTTDDITVLGWDDAICRMLEPYVPGHLLWFSRMDIVSNGAFLAGSRLGVAGLASPNGDPVILCEVEDIPLRGEHNISNVLAACALAGTAGVPPEVMVETIRTFEAVPHRLEVVRVVNGVTYVNDSIATAPERVLAALKSYTEPLVLLAGGADKKLPWDAMIALALEKSRHIIAFGRDGDIVVNTVRKITGNTDRVTRVQTLDEAVDCAVRVAQSGDIVLLSPGGTSYDAYKDFVQRGDHFRQLVNAL